MSDDKSREKPVPEGFRRAPNGGLLKTGGIHEKAGRPEGSVSLVTAMKRFLRDDPSRVDELVASWFDQAKDGDSAYSRLWLDRVDGPVQQQVDVTSGGDKVQITFGMPVVPQEESE